MIKAVEFSSSEPIYRRIASHIRELIASGELSPGDRLPTTLELAEKFNVADKTIQKSLKHLVEQGVVRRVPHHGTFIRENIGNKTIAMVSARNFFHESDLRATVVALGETLEYVTSQGWDFKFYLNATEETEPQMLLNLENDIAQDKLKAIFVVISSDGITDWLTSANTLPYEKAEAVCNDDYYFQPMLRDGMKYLAKLGHRDIAVLTSEHDPALLTETEELVKQLTDELHLNTDLWIAENFYPKSGMKLVQEKLAQLDHLPDAMFVLNDNLCQGALTTLSAAGIKAPEDLSLLTHANCGIDILYPKEVSRLEVDFSSMFKNGMDALFGRLQGEEICRDRETLKLIVGETCVEKD